MSNGTTTWSYTYNADGLRTSRTNGTTTYNYTYNGDKLTYMTVGDNLHLHFAYDASGVPMSVTYNGTTYYYVTNVQGDVIGILDNNGTQVATYAYDAWGTPLPGTESQTSEIGTLNPLRYRGYVWDSETKLYYLQSRYYNPEMGRFINSDDPAYLGVNGLLSYNLFAYCENNPIMGYDPTGCWSWGTKEQLALGTTVLIIGLALLLAVPTGGASLGAGALAISATTAITAGSALAVTGTIMVGDALNQASISAAKQSKKSDKERSKDKPSWVSRSDVDPNKSAQQNAKALMDNKYGSTWPKGTREYSQIVKWINRCVRNLVIAIAVEQMEE